MKGLHKGKGSQIKVPVTHMVKDHFEQAVLNQYVARHLASRAAGK